MFSSPLTVCRNSALLTVAYVTVKMIWKRWVPEPKPECQYRSEARVIFPLTNGQAHILMKQEDDFVCEDRFCPCITYRWLISKIDEAVEKIDIAMYFITSPLCADAIIRAKRRGVRVRAIVQYDLNDTDTEWLKMQRADITVTMQKLPPSQLMHQKMLLIDGVTAFMGSINFTSSGFSENYEEFICSANPDVVLWCNKYFEDLCSKINEQNRFMFMCLSGDFHNGD